LKLNRKYFYLLGFAAIAMILIAAIILNPSSDFGGTDNSGGEAIGDIDPNYEPWFHSLWEPSSETATLLFCLQTAIGALIIGYFIGANSKKGKAPTQEGRKE
jgi:cobalt/nickel transport protein